MTRLRGLVGAPSKKSQAPRLNGYDSVLETLQQFYPAGLHVVFEAAHSQGLGRPSDAVVKQMLQNPLMQDPDIGISFPSDRLQIDKRVTECHLLCVGGPRSNVVAREILEYENRASEHQHEYYSRINRPTVQLPVIYVQNPHLLLADDFAEDFKTAFDKVEANYFTPRNGSPKGTKDATAAHAAIAGITAAYGTRRAKKPKRMLVAEGRANLSAFIPVELYPELGDGDSRLPSSDGEADVLLDFVWITIMPNPYAPQEKDLKAIIVSGCTAMGTSKFMHAEVVRQIDELLREKKQRGKETGFQLVIPVLAGVPQHSNKDQRTGGGNRPSVGPCTFGDAEPFPLKIDTKSDWGAYCDELVEALDKKPADITKQMVELNRIDANQLLRALQYNHQGKAEPENIFVLGCFEGTKTFATQQGRAFSFVHALHKSGRFVPDMRLVVIGGGLSGLAVAVAAASTRITVHLIEKKKKSEFLSHLAGGKHRFIHPTVYDWPMNATDYNWVRSAGNLNVSGIPFFPWKAGTADAVSAEIRDAYNRERDKVKLRYGEDRIVEHTGATAHSIRVSDSEYFIEFVDDKGQARYVIGDAVVIAAGFSEEKKIWVVPSGNGWDLTNETPSSIDITDVPALRPFVLSDGYWKDDSHRFGDVKQRPLLGIDSDGKTNNLRKFVVVSGQGDGALIDILRLGIKDFRHENVLNNLCYGIDKDGKTDAKAKYEVFRKMGVAMHRTTNSDDYRRGTNRQRHKLLEEAFADLPVRELFDLMGLVLEPDVRVVNVTKSGSPFLAPSAISNRLLVWSLFLNRRLEFISGNVVRLETKPTDRQVDVAGESLERLCVSIQRSSHAYGGVTGTRADQIRNIGNVVGLVFRHGIYDGKPVQDIKFPTMNVDSKVADPFLLQQLISILNLTSRPHPETIKFFLHNTRQFR